MRSVKDTRVKISDKITNKKMWQYKCGILLSIRIILWQIRELQQSSFICNVNYILGFFKAINQKIIYNHCVNSHKKDIVTIQVLQYMPTTIKGVLSAIDFRIYTESEKRPNYFTIWCTQLYPTFCAIGYFCGSKMWPQITCQTTMYRANVPGKAIIVCHICQTHLFKLSLSGMTILLVI